MKTGKTRAPKKNKDLQDDEASINLPDVNDIPGQKNIKPAPLGELADTTTSSDDEEGRDTLDSKDELIKGDPNVSAAERKALSDAAEKMPTEDEENLEKAQLEDVDEDGEPLNEQTDLSGSDLDVPGSEDDDANEEIGEEDEENNTYSLDDEHEDENNTRQ
jgi:hypothetical protein